MQQRPGVAVYARCITNQPSVHSDHGCQEGCARRPREAVRTLQYGSHASHRHECEIHMRHCHGRLPLLCAPVLKPPSTLSACWPLLHTCDWLKLSPRPARDALTAISTISFTCWSRHKRAMSTYSLRSRVRPRPQGQAYFPPCRRGGFLRASRPAAHVQLAYVDAFTCSHHRLSSVYSPACTIQSSHHGGRRA